MKIQTWLLGAVAGLVDVSAQLSIFGQTVTWIDGGGDNNSSTGLIWNPAAVVG